MYNIYKNFLNELNTKCANYFIEDDYDNIAKRQINKTYRFLTYKNFVNNVIGRRVKGSDTRIIKNKISSFLYYYRAINRRANRL